MSPDIRSATPELVASLTVGTGLLPKTEPRPVVKQMRLAPPGDHAGHGHRVVARGVHEDQSRTGHGLGVLAHGGERAVAALGDRAERLLEDRGDATLLVARRGVAVEGRAWTAGVVLPPRDPVEQRLPDGGVGGALGEHPLGAVDLGRLPQHAGPTRGDEQVAGDTECRVRGQPGPGVRPAALEPEDEVRDADLDPRGTTHLLGKTANQLLPVGDCGRGAACVLDRERLGGQALVRRRGSRRDRSPR